MRVFEDVTVLEGNHDRLVERQFLKNGLPEEWRKKFCRSFRVRERMDLSEI